MKTFALSTIFMAIVFHLHTFGDVYWPNKSLHPTEKDLMIHIDKCIKQNSKPKDTANYEYKLTHGYTVTKIDTRSFPLYKHFFREEKHTKRGCYGPDARDEERSS